MGEVPPSVPGDTGPPPLPPPAPPAPAGARAPRDEKILLVLCYVGLLALVPYLVSREAEGLRFHARQGLALGLLGIGCAGLGVVALSIVGIVKALEGARWRMPVAADVADRLEL